MKTFFYKTELLCFSLKHYFRDSNSDHLILGRFNAQFLNEIDYLKRFNLRHSGRRHLPEEPGVPERATLPQDVGAEGGLRHAAEGHRVHDRQVKGCQICLGPNIPKLGKIYQMATNYTKLP
jgi:hypothetical protein